MNAHLPKFKAWDVTRKEWMDYGFCLRFDANGNCEVLNAFAEPFKNKEIVLVQWTGLKDKQGKDIYEGGIIKIEDTTAHVVFWQKPPEFGLEPHDENKWCEDWNLSDDSERMTIIDNICHQYGNRPRSALFEIKERVEPYVEK